MFIAYLVHISGIFVLSLETKDSDGGQSSYWEGGTVPLGVRRRGLWALNVAHGTILGREGQSGDGRGSSALDWDLHFAIVSCCN